MPNINDFLKGFGLYTGDTLNGFVIKSSTGSHSRVSLGKYTYQFTLKIGGKGSDNELLKVINEKTSKSKVIKAKINYYFCSLSPISHEQIEDLPHEWIVHIEGNSHKI